MPYRLGDDVDDYCIKCKRITNHAIVSLMGEDPAKVRCRTCYNDHDFRRCEIPPSKKDLKKMALLSEALAAGGAAAGAPAGTSADAPVDAPADAAAEGATEAVAAGASDAAAPESAEPAPKAKKAAKKAKG
ncbi:MAG: hypothetical protein JNL98_27310 [Bryobacterales bacterium]|nr:hypothetical protein [Bryobacterales bacterium]